MAALAAGTQQKLSNLFLPFDNLQTLVLISYFCLLFKCNIWKLIYLFENEIEWLKKGQFYFLFKFDMSLMVHLL